MYNVIPNLLCTEDQKISIFILCNIISKKSSWRPESYLFNSCNAEV